MPLPIVSGTEVSTPQAGVKINPSALREAALAPGRLGAEIGSSVGGLFEGISQQIQETRNARKVFDADMAMRKTKEDFLTDIVKNPELASDPTKWAPAYQERVKQTQDAILGQQDLGPKVKRHLSEVTGLWGLSTLSEIRTQALRREQADNYAAGIAVATKALQDDSDGSGVATATAAYRELNRMGLLGPKEMEQKIAEAPAIAAEAQANTVIATNPIQAPRIIQEQLAGKLPPQKARIIKHVALQAQARAQADNQEALSAQIDDNPLHTIDDAVLKAARDRQDISVPGYQKLLARQKAYATTATAEQNRQERDEFNIAMLEADAPPTDAKALDTWARDLREQGLSWTNPALRRRLNEYVDRKVNSVRKEGEKDERPVENQIYSLMDEDRTHGGAFIPTYTEKGRTGFFGIGAKPDKTVHFGGGLSELRKLTDNQAEKMFGEGTTARKVLAAEQLNYAKKRAEMRQWFKAQEDAGKKPTIEEANEYRMKLEAPDIVAAVASMVPAPGKRRLVRQNGKVYDYDTGEEVK